MVSFPKYESYQSTEEGIYPAKSCVDLTTTIKAAKVFAELGTMERSVSWEREGIPEPV